MSLCTASTLRPEEAARHNLAVTQTQTRTRTRTAQHIDGGGGGGMQRPRQASSRCSAARRDVWSNFTYSIRVTAGVSASELIKRYGAPDQCRKDSVRNSKRRNQSMARPQDKKRSWPAPTTDRSSFSAFGALGPHHVFFPFFPSFRKSPAYLVLVLILVLSDLVIYYCILLFFSFFFFFVVLSFFVIFCS